MTLKEYISEFQSMNCNSIRGFTAPHKPILLLTIVKLFEERLVSNNLIKPSEQLSIFFQETWNKYVEQETPYNCVLSTPFFHMDHEPFWHLIPSENYERRSEYSLGQLRKCYKGASLDEELFSYLQDDKSRQQIEESIISHFFSKRENRNLNDEKSVVSSKALNLTNIKQKTMPVVHLNPNNYFDSLLIKRGLDKCPQPLWRLKIKDDEYVELKRILAAASMDRRFRFDLLTKEAALFFAQFWRREYTGGPHSIQMVYDALGSSSQIPEIEEEFYKAAHKGAKKLGIELYVGETGRRDTLNSILYQGGLPMNFISGEGTNSVWDRFMRGLVNKKINFDELNLGIVATQSSSLREFCNQLIEAVERNQHKLMPFYCKDENDSWFIYLKDLAKQERIRKINLHPFSLNWEFRVNTIDHRIESRFVLSGAQRLQPLFLDDNGLSQYPSFSVQVRVNGKASDTYDYVNGFCRYVVCSKHTYRPGDEVSLFLHTKDEAYISDSLDTTAPLLLYMGKDGNYLLGNQIGKSPSLILVPDEWEVDDSERFKVSTYQWDNNGVRGLEIPQDYTGIITVRNGNDVITYSENADLHWTELSSMPKYCPAIVESIYNASDCKFSICSDSGDKQTNFSNYSIRFRSKHQREWVEEAPLGEIFAKVNNNSGYYVAPTKFINVGDGLVVSLLSADRDSCQIKVSWPYGHVSTNEGTRKNDDVWMIQKSDCLDPRKIRFSFVPTANPENQFSLTVKAPFRDFTIINPDGMPLETDSFVPYTDIDKYQYHIVGLDVKSFKFGDTERQIKWIGDKLYIIERDDRLRTIPYEGSLLTLFDSRESLREILGKTSKGILDASVPVTFVTTTNESFSLEIKESPYRASQGENGVVTIHDKNNRLLDFKGSLKLFKMDDPSLDPLILTFNDECGYVLPDEIRSWGKTLLTGRTRGRILPMMVDLSTDVTPEYRRGSRSEAKMRIAQELQSATMGDEFWKRVIGWFECSQNNDIPASSILDLAGVAMDSKSLLYLAFGLYTKCSSDDERDTLSSQLQTFAQDLAFQWFWIAPVLNGIMMNVYSFIGSLENPSLKEIYIQWASNKENRFELWSAISDDDKYAQNIGQCLNEVLTSFTGWMKKLCQDSATDTYESHINQNSKFIIEKYLDNPGRVIEYSTDSLGYVPISQNDVDDEVKTFFDAFEEPSKYDNDLWLYQRASAVAAHLNNKINLLNQPARVKRSVIFCSKSCNETFMIVLNNKLCKR